jgi:two-component system sensor histidine kinase SenX3
VNLFGRVDQGRRPREVDSLRDDLDQARAEIDQLRTDNAILSAAFRSAPGGLILLDDKCRVLLRNASSTFGSHIDVLVDGAVQSICADRRLGNAVDVAVTQRLELYGPPQRVLVLTGFPVGDGRVLVAIDDVSERVRLDAVRTDFVANISHELKTPVGALALLAETIEGCDEIEDVRPLAARMVDEAHRAGGTIDDLLELSRIELAEPEREEIPALIVVSEAVARHRLAADRAGLAVHVDVDRECVLFCDRLQVVSAIANLLDNSIKYSDRGGEIVVTGCQDESMIEIAVTDRGVGIPARDLDRVFERFYRVDRARSRETGGTGLGLAIVRHVVNNHGGEATVVSREGEGSTFTLRLPAGEPS